MKLLTKSIAVGVILTIMFSLVSFNARCGRLSDDIFRLHILANSDSEADQELKLKVRDKVLEYTKTIYRKCKTKDDTIKITKENLNNILAVANSEILKQGYDYTVDAEITNMYFNVREYGSYTVPAGYYDALRLKIGKGEGHNWWCVMYPSFCIGESASLEDSNLSESEKNLVSDGEKYKVKFKIFELYEQFTDWIS